MIYVRQLFDILYHYFGFNRYVSATIVLAIFFFLSKFALWITEKIFLKFTEKTKTKIDDIIINAVHKPMSWIILIFGFKIFFLELWSEMAFEKYLDNFLNSILVVLFMLILLRIFDDLIRQWVIDRGAKTHSKIDTQFLKLMHQFSKILFFILVFLWILSIWGVQVGPFLAGLGIGGIAIAFALQSTLSNIFGGISLILDHTLRVGDVIKLDSGEEGTVYEIGIRSTKIKTFNNEILTIPNGRLMDSRITNYNQPDNNVRVTINFSVAYGSKIDYVKKVALESLKGEPDVLSEPQPKVLFLEMADSGLNFRLMFYVPLDKKWDVHQNVITKLYDLLNKHKINIPFPQREVWVHNVR